MQLVLPVDDWKWPAVHEMHVERAVLGLYLPTGQDLQVVCAVLLVYFPVVQLLHHARFDHAL